MKLKDLSIDEMHTIRYFGGASDVTIDEVLMSTVYQLCLHGILQSDDFNNDKFSLTDKGKELYKQCLEYEVERRR